MRQQQHANLTVLDVYDEAALIGKDFERIIEGERENDERNAFDLLLL